ncbi:MAG TPA: sialidase family protein [Thermoanaerobaculia bacterium]
MTRAAILTAILLTACFHAPAPVREVSVPSGKGAAEPFLFAARDGSLLLSWIDDGSVRMARYRDGKWSAPSTVVRRNDLFVNWADFPSVVEMPGGTLLAHWLQKSGSGTYAYDVRLARSKDGGRTWSPSAVLHDDGTQTEHGFVSLVPDTTRPLVHALWLDGRKMQGQGDGHEHGGDMSLRYATVDANGRIAKGAELDGRACECCTTGMTMTANGLVAAYRDRDANEVRDISVVRATGNGWTKPASLHADKWTINGCPVNGPQLDARGRDVVAAWFTGAADQPRVYVAFSADAGATFGKPVRVDGNAPTGRVDVLLLPDRSAFVTWIDGAGTDTAFVARRVTRDGKAGPIVTLAKSTTARGAGFPRAAQIGKDTYVAWTELQPEKRIRLASVRLQ